MTDSNQVLIPSNAHVFQKRSEMKTTLEQMTAFHQDPKALQTLTPPPIFMQMHHDTRTSITSGELEFTLWFVIFPIRWIAQHQPGPTPTSFVDVQIKGPLAYWRHEHIFEATAQGVALIDRVTLAHRPGLQGVLTRLMFDGLPLQLLFFYRHLRTRLAVERG
jgi:ligand-binding SRPBCC domain-containing protein